MIPKNLPVPRASHQSINFTLTALLHTLCFDAVYALILKFKGSLLHDFIPAI